MKEILNNDKAILSVIGWIIASLFTIVVLVGLYSMILDDITTPIINATNNTDAQAISQNAVNRGYTGIDFFGIVIPIFLVVGFLGYLIIRERGI